MKGVNISQNGQRVFWFGCAACVGAYVFYRYWKTRELRSIDEGFEDVTKIEDGNERRILLLGLDGAGKTSVMNQAIVIDNKNNSYQVPPKPTDGFAVYRLEKGDYTFNIWEIGGAEQVRKHWNNFLQDTDLLVFMVDASDTNKLSLAVSTLKQLVGDSRINNVPILVVANKQDVPSALKPEQIRETLDLNSISPHQHKVEVIGCQTRPLPNRETQTNEYNWYHPSIETIRKKMFSLASMT